MKGLGINTAGSARSIPYTDSFDEILKTHENFINSVGLEMCEDKIFHICIGPQSYIRNKILLLASINA